MSGPYVNVKCDTCGHYYEVDEMYASQAECQTCRTAERERYLEREREDRIRYAREWEEDQEFKKRHNED